MAAQISIDDIWLKLNVSEEIWHPKLKCYWVSWLARDEETLVLLLGENSSCDMTGATYLAESLHPSADVLIVYNRGGRNPACWYNKIDGKWHFNEGQSRAAMSASSSR